MGKVRELTPKARAVLVWRDGRRELTEFFGGTRIHQTWDHSDSGRRMETSFLISPETTGEDSTEWQYREEATKDVSQETREAWARFHYETNGPRPRFEAEDRMFLPGETPEEQKRRINIEKYGTPTPAHGDPKDGK